MGIKSFWVMFEEGVGCEAYRKAGRGHLKHDKKCRAVEHNKINGKWGPSLFDYFADLQL